MRTDPMPPIQIQRQPGTPADFPLPSRAHATDAGLDLRACLPPGREVEVHSGRVYSQPASGSGVYLPPGARAAIPCGFAFSIPDGFEGQLRPRSGLSLRTGYRVHLGTIDASYRGEVRIIIEAGPGGMTIRHGDRIAQMVIAPVSLAGVVEVESLPESARGVGGFGSTG